LVSHGGVLSVWTNFAKRRRHWSVDFDLQHVEASPWTHTGGPAIAEFYLPVLDRRVLK
jgi:hypothetical protein